MSTLPDDGEILEGLPFAQITAMALDRAEVLWLVNASHGGIVAIRGGEIRRFHRTSSPIPDAAITAVFVDRDDVKWFASARRFVFTYDGRAFRVVRVPTDGGPLLERITQDQAGRIWLCAQHGRAIACYDGATLDESLTEKVKALGARAVHRAMDGALWMVADSPHPRKTRILRFDGQDFHPTDFDAPPNLTEPRALHVDAPTETLYICSGDAVVRCKGGVSARATPESLGLAAFGMELVAIDRSHHLWVRWQPRVGRDTRLGRIGEEGVIDFTRDTPLEPGWRGDVLEDPRGRLWFAGARTGLVMLDAGGWTIFPVAPQEARSPLYRREDLELFEEPTVAPDIPRLFADPRAYHGQQLSLVGEIRPGIEHGGLVLQGEEESRGIFADRLRATSLMRRTGIDLGLELRPGVRREYVGFLEYEGGYGPTGNCPYRFTMTEAYPHPCTEEERRMIHKLYRERLDREVLDARAIHAVVESWKDAVLRADVEALQKLAYADAPWANGLRAPGAAARAWEARLRIDYEKPWIRFEDEAAHVRLLGARIEPVAPTRKGTYALRGLSFARVKGAWKIRAVALDFQPEGPDGLLEERRRVSEVEVLNARLGPAYFHPLEGTPTPSRGSP